MRKYAWLIALLAGLTAAVARAEPAPPSPALAAPSPRVMQETAAVTLRDDRKQTVTLRVPRALHRPANAFRLYGPRPLTLHSRDRRRDLYRDAFLELATRAQLAPAASVWDSFSQQLAWSGTRAGLYPGEKPYGNGTDPHLEKQGLALLAAAPSSYRHLTALGEALRSFGVDLGASEPVVNALRLRAVATDSAEQRLLLLGEALKVSGPGTDPALREGYEAAKAEFAQVRQGLWPAIAASVRKNEGRLIAGAIKDIVLSHLGVWAIFGHAGWQGVERVLNVEYHGQYAVCLATVAAELATATSRPEYQPLALYAEYALNYELTEALKSGSVMPLKPAGGRTAGGWQIEFSGRRDELRKALAPG